MHVLIFIRLADLRAGVLSYVRQQDASTKMTVFLGHPSPTQGIIFTRFWMKVPHGVLFFKFANSYGKIIGLASRRAVYVSSGQQSSHILAAESLVICLESL